jgi:hypothetical protein
VASWETRALRRRCGIPVRAALAAVVLAVAAPVVAAEPAGTVGIEQVRVAFWASGDVGGGTLTFGGKSRPFTVGRLGVGHAPACSRPTSGSGAGSITLRRYAPELAVDDAGAVSEAALGIAFCKDFRVTLPPGNE